MKLEWLVLIGFGYLVYRAAQSQATPTQPPATGYEQYTTPATCEAAGGVWGIETGIVGRCHPPGTVWAI